MAIRWEKTYDEALSKARTEQRPLFVDFYHPD
jgi:hypothetical protein